MNTTQNKQMELTFNGVQTTAPNSPRQRRIRVARWWFERMHQVVDQAFDWRPALPPRPEQRWLSYRG